LPQIARTASVAQTPWLTLRQETPRAPHETKSQPLSSRMRAVENVLKNTPKTRDENDTTKTHDKKDTTKKDLRKTRPKLRSIGRLA
jgi:hypothetical protein